MVTEISTREVAVVLAWAGRHAGHGIVAGARAAWRVARAAFPEKDDNAEERRPRERREPESDADDADGGDRDRRAGARRRR